MSEATNALYEAVTDKLVVLIEAGTLPWRRDWRDAFAGAGLPFNPFTRRHYSGINVVLLWAEGMAKGYPTQRWATFRQVLEAGGHVRRGERGTRIVFYRTLDLKDETSDGETKKIPLLKSFTVFNRAQCDGLGEAESPPGPVAPFDRDERAETFVRHVGADVRFNGGRAFYRPLGDYIEMPQAELFQTQVAYYATLIHELTHWTGHTSRLDRLKLGERYGSESYAFEELIAELGASFICAELGLNSDLPNHASYLESWLRVLRSDKRAIFRAAAAAATAADYLRRLQPAPEAGAELAGCAAAVPAPLGRPAAALAGEAMHP